MFNFFLLPIEKTSSCFMSYWFTINVCNVYGLSIRHRFKQIGKRSNWNGRGSANQNFRIIGQLLFETNPNIELQLIPSQPSRMHPISIYGGRGKRLRWVGWKDPRIQGACKPPYTCICVCEREKAEEWSCRWWGFASYDRLILSTGCLPINLS